MTKTMIRLASEQDAEKLQQLMHEAFTPLREQVLIGLQLMLI